MTSLQVVHPVINLITAVYHMYVYQMCTEEAFCSKIGCNAYSHDGTAFKLWAWLKSQAKLTTSLHLAKLAAANICKYTRAHMVVGKQDKTS